jgi:hypothetical protein
MPGTPLAADAIGAACGGVIKDESRGAKKLWEEDDMGWLCSMRTAVRGAHAKLASPCARGVKPV